MIWNIKSKLNEMWGVLLDNKVKLAVIAFLYVVADYLNFMTISGFIMSEGKDSGYAVALSLIGLFKFLFVFIVIYVVTSESYEKATGAWMDKLGKFGGAIGVGRGIFRQVINFIKRMFNLTSALIVFIGFLMFAVFSLILSVSIPEVFTGLSSVYAEYSQYANDPEYAFPIKEAYLNGLNQLNIFNLILIIPVSLFFYYVLIMSTLLGYIKGVSGEEGVFKVIYSSVNKSIKYSLYVILSVVIFFIVKSVLFAIAAYLDFMVFHFVISLLGWLLSISLVVFFYVISKEKEVSRI